MERPENSRVPTPNYWRVLLKRGRKAHLAPFLVGQSSGDIALCRQVLPSDGRKGSAVTITQPFGNECEACLRASGFRLKPEMTLEQRRIAALGKVARFLQYNLGLSSSDVAEVMRSLPEKAEDRKKEEDAVTVQPDVDVEPGQGG